MAKPDCWRRRLRLWLSRWWQPSVVLARSMLRAGWSFKLPDQCLWAPGAEVDGPRPPRFLDLPCRRPDPARIRVSETPLPARSPFDLAGPWLRAAGFGLASAGLGWLLAGLGRAAFLAHGGLMATGSESSRIRFVDRLRDTKDPKRRYEYVPLGWPASSNPFARGVPSGLAFKVRGWRLPGVCGGAAAGGPAPLAGGFPTP